MSHTAVSADPLCLDHDAGPGHPERPDRMRVAIQALTDPDRSFVELQSWDANPDDLVLVHDPRYIDALAAFAGRSLRLDPDTRGGPRSWQAALRAAGNCIAATKTVLDGAARNAFVAVRPPGHHAEPQRGMGFCLLSNVAIAARWAQQHAGVDKIAIVDFDVHHGNGTQAAFWFDPSVLYVSSHQFPFYPGTGAVAETGGDAGEDATVNLPLSGGCGDDVYGALYGGVVDPIIRAFNPDLVLVSAGYDAHVNDPLATMQVTKAGFEAIAGHLRNVADDVCDGRIVFMLEGGYDLDGLRDGIDATLDVLTGRTSVPRVTAKLDALSLGPAARYAQDIVDRHARR